jgi:hypothetical protein
MKAGGRRSPRRALREELERMPGLFRDRYTDFTVKHFHEPLVKPHGYEFGYTVTKLRRWLLRRASLWDPTSHACHRSWLEGDEAELLNFAVRNLLSRNATPKQIVEIGS